MGRTPWALIGAVGVVLGCTGTANQSQQPSSADTTAAAPVVTPADSMTRQDHSRHRVRESTGGEVVQKTAMIPVGTTMSLTSNQKICTNTNHVGDTFTANLANAVSTSTGGTVPAGATVMLGVTQVKPSDNVAQHGQIGIQVDSLNVNGRSYPLDADIVSVKTTKVRATSMGQEATKTGIGTAAGALIGGIIGRSAKTALIGAAAGTAAGAGTAYATTKYDFCIPQGGAITTKLSSPATIHAGTM
ncbi:MAG TPA: hypothetical protein VFA43_02755 [Gemmatimonadaceae bacterium]|nr:hypothetical protein [Gemmatimonadaceae bacterium]